MGKSYFPQYSKSLKIINNIRLAVNYPQPLKTVGALRKLSVRMTLQWDRNCLLPPKRSSENRSKTTPPLKTPLKRALSSHLKRLLTNPRRRIPQNSSSLRAWLWLIPKASPKWKLKSDTWPKSRCVRATITFWRHRVPTNSTPAKLRVVCSNLITMSSISLASIKFAVTPETKLNKV